MIRSYPEDVLVAYSTKGKAALFSVPSNKQLAIYNVRAFNNSGSTASVGILRKFIAGKYQLWTITGGGSPVYTDVTSTVNAGSATQVVDTTNNDGFIVQSERRSGLIGVTVSTAGSSGTYTFSYWNGSSFTALTTLENPTNFASTGDAWVVFRPPSDWVVGGPTGVNQNRYSIQVQATAAPAGAVSINNLWVAGWLELYSGIATNQGVQLSYPDSKPYELQGGENLIPYFSVANAANQFGAYYSLV